MTNNFYSEIGRTADRSLKAKCFQLIGIDIFFDDKLKPYFLEANTFPHMTHYISYKDLKGNSIRLNSKVHEFAKTLFISDALKVVGSL